MIDWLRRPAGDPVIELCGRKLPIEVTRHRTARRLVLRLAPDGMSVRVTLPQWCRAAEGVAFAQARRGWLKAQIAKVPERGDPLQRGRIAFRGDDILVEWNPAAPRRPTLEQGRLTLGGPREGSDRRLARWLEEEALALFTMDARAYCDRAGVAPAPVRLSRARRRWGSCSSEGLLRLNWRLVMAPDMVRRSVVAHEVAHLVHFDHSPSFHALLAAIYESDLGEANAWLRSQGRTLYTALG